MKAHLGAVLLLTVGLGTVALDPSRAVATTSYTATKSQSQPILGERILIRGVLKPAGRPISLQVYRHGVWTTTVTKKTGSGGHWAFAVEAGSVRHAYRTTVPETRVGGTRYSSARSNLVRVQGVTPRLTLHMVPAPVGQNRSGTANLTPGVARLSPARPGSPVTIQRYHDGAWHSVVTWGHQSSTGRFRFNTPGGSQANPATLRALTWPGHGVARVASTTTKAYHLTRTFADGFANPVYSRHHWKTRAQSPTGLRKCSRPDKSMISYTHGKAVLRVKRVLPPDRGCPMGHFWNAMVGTSEAMSPFQQKYGIFAARVKFESGQGMHGAYWLQGRPVSGDEIDTIEYYGAGRRDGGLSNLVHHVNRYGHVSSSGGVQRDTKAILAPRRTPANSYHVYSVQWSPSGYTFRMDGFQTFHTKKPHIATQAEYMIMSLVTSDWELSRYRSGSSWMKVDWVRAWSY